MAKKRRKTPKTRPPLPPLDLDNLESSRNSMAELIKRYYAGKVRDGRARTLAYLFQTFLAYLKAEAELSIMGRLTALEEKVHGFQKDR
jgi:hypothetical protein